MEPIDVNPQAWSEHEVIFIDSNNGFSAIWGKYNGVLCLGTRWNGANNERGYPGQGPYPLWYVEPEFLNLTILQQLYLEAIRSKEKDPTGKYYYEKIARTIQDYIMIQ